MTFAFSGNLPRAKIERRCSGKNITLCPSLDRRLQVATDLVDTYPLTSRMSSPPAVQADLSCHLICLALREGHLDQQRGVAAGPSAVSASLALRLHKHLVIVATLRSNVLNLLTFFKFLFLVWRKKTGFYALSPKTARSASWRPVSNHNIHRTTFK